MERIYAIGVFAGMKAALAFAPVPSWSASGQPSGLEEINVSSKPGAVPMNFVEKLNVVAAYAAFAFVCAIIFGMV